MNIEKKAVVIGGSNGIGLAVANEIMELHSGSLDIDSQEGMGTTVIITMPTLKKLESNPELSNTMQIPTTGDRVQVVELKPERSGGKE